LGGVIEIRSASDDEAQQREVGFRPEPSFSTVVLRGPLG
jgi:hypothetical protein